VKQGDSLWKIARRYFDDDPEYGGIVAANKAAIPDRPGI